ncbi:MAG: hypothetical protein EOO56_03650 [Hymenobacter sp.]|nr:MAG: hypothetical protein EOO56_03650 [Hymenobacter sp.]
MRTYLLAAACCLLTSFAYAQLPPTGGPAPSNVPIDGGASILLASGVAYGLRRLKQRRRS